MMVSKMKPQYCHRTDLFVDSWKIKHLANGSFEEEFVEEVAMNENKIHYVPGQCAF